MKNNPTLFLYSMSLTDAHFTALENLVGKPTEEITIACIENAADIIDGSAQWVPAIRQSLIDTGFKAEPVDLRNYTENNETLLQHLQGKDIIWIGGGHTYYLSWILKQSGADEMIKTLVQNGTVFAGWSAGAIMAGPTTKFFHLMGDDPAGAPALIEEGLNLTDIVVVPHIDHTEFATGAAEANAALIAAGFKTAPLKDNQALIVQGDDHKLI